MPIVVPMRTQIKGQPAPVPPPDPTYTLMAATQMHDEGRLPSGFNEAGWKQFPESNNIEDRRLDPNNPDNSAWTEEAQIRRSFDLDKTSRPYGRFSPPMTDE